MEIADSDGQLCERWDGLRLRVINKATAPGPWVGPLLAPYFERRMREMVPGAAVCIRVERHGELKRRARTDKVIQLALGEFVPVRRRYDGRPEVIGEREVSAAHAGNFTLALAGPGPLGCDVEPVVARPRLVWRDLLGPDRINLAEVIVRETGEDFDAAATRAWAAGECLKKAGAMPDMPLLLESFTADGWVTLTAGELVAATYVNSVIGYKGRLAFGLLVRRSDASLPVSAHRRL
jgi:enediyne polyketide synthase